MKISRSTVTQCFSIWLSHPFSCYITRWSNQASA